MFCCNRIDLSEGNDIANSNNSKECIACHCRQGFPCWRYVEGSPHHHHPEICSSPPPGKIPPPPQ